MAMTYKMKQTQLEFLSYYTDNIDGLWGPKSTEATKQFQRAYDLDDDGAFGPLTEDKSKDVVKAIQEKIKQYNSAMICDGLAGPMTKTALQAYQRANSLTVTGIADYNTLAKMGIDADYFEDDSDEIEAPVYSTGTSIKPVTGTWWDNIKYFEKSEFKCKCGGRYCNGYPQEPQQKLVELLEKVRIHFGKVIIITSGLRCPTHNKNEGGVSNSRHQYGKAVDFCVQGVSGAAVLAYVQSLPGVRYAYIISGNYVHMDIN